MVNDHKCSGLTRPSFIISRFCRSEGGGGREGWWWRGAWLPSYSFIGWNQDIGQAMLSSVGWGEVYFNAYVGCWENSVLWSVGSLECRNGFLLAVVWGHLSSRRLLSGPSMWPPSSSDINCILNPSHFWILSDFLFFDQQRKFLLLNGVWLDYAYPVIFVF